MILLPFEKGGFKPPKEKYQKKKEASSLNILYFSEQREAQLISIHQILYYSFQEVLVLAIKISYEETDHKF